MATLAELTYQNRSVRGFRQDARPDEKTLKALIALTRHCASSRNAQPLKYLLSCDDTLNARIQPLTHWAARLTGMKLPHPGKEPTAFIVILHDTNIMPNPAQSEKDVGIIVQTLLLGAVEKGFGGCMNGAFSPEALSKELKLPDHLVPKLIIALGVPDETIILEDAPAGQLDEAHAYYRDENDVHHVVKRPLEELLVQPGETEDVRQ